MPTTRSASKKQASLDNFKQDDGAITKLKTSKGSTKLQPKSDSRSPTSRKANSSAKRKYTSEAMPNPQVSKKSKSDASATKQAHFSGKDGTDLETPIMINRSPVLQLWASTVAQFLHPDETWESCLSIGGSISTLCAISKGRAIGKVEPKDDSAELAQKRKKRTQETKNETREVEVMSFPLQLKDNSVVVDGKPKPVKEGLLRNKFGGELNYVRVRSVMEEALDSWKDDKDELDKKAFHMYEKFRPNVASGSSGWGRKGELNLHEVKNSITR